MLLFVVKNVNESYNVPGQNFNGKNEFKILCLIFRKKLKSLKRFWRL